MTFTGTIISAGDNDEGTPRLEIEVDREALKRSTDSWLFKRVTITVEPTIKPDAGKVCSRCGNELGSIGYSLTDDGPEFCGPCMNFKLSKERL